MEVIQHPAVATRVSQPSAKDVAEVVNQSSSLREVAVEDPRGEILRAIAPEERVRRLVKFLQGFGKEPVVVREPGQEGGLGGAVGDPPRGVLEKLAHQLTDLSIVVDDRRESR